MALHLLNRRIGLLVLLFAVLGPGKSQAASCFSGSQIVPPAKVNADKDAIKADAAKWLLSRGGKLSSAVRDLAASDPDFAATIVSSSKGTSPQQAAAIGAGLGQAKATCIDKPEEAAKIQNAAASSSDESLAVSFNSTTGDTQTAAVDGGATAAGGTTAGGGGSTNAATTPSTTAATTSPTTTLPAATASGVKNGFVNLLTGGSAASTSATATPRASTTTAGAATVNSIN